MEKRGRHQRGGLRWSPGGYEFCLQQMVFQIISASFCRDVLVSEFVVCCFIVLLFQPNLLNQMGLLLALCKGALKHNSSFFFLAFVILVTGILEFPDRLTVPHVQISASVSPSHQPSLGLHVFPCLSWS